MVPNKQVLPGQFCIHRHHPSIALRGKGASWEVASRERRRICADSCDHHRRRLHRRLPRPHQRPSLTSVDATCLPRSGCNTSCPILVGRECRSPNSLARCSSEREEGHRSRSAATSVRHYNLRSRNLGSSGVGVDPALIVSAGARVLKRTLSFAALPSPSLRTTETSPSEDCFLIAISRSLT